MVRRRRSAHAALRDVSMQAHFGEMLLIVGPSGSGKTTLLSVISGILRPDGGSVSIDGVDLWAQPNDAIAEFRLNRIGFVFQDYHLFRGSRPPRTSQFR
jgi:putative ABC transport system ATP-binding protein